MANTSIQVTDLDFQEIKAGLKTFLESQAEFSDYNFSGSGLNVLLDILAYNTHYNAYYLNMVANESFMDTAVTRNSVVSHAKKYGYTPRSATAPTATINVEITPSVSNLSGTFTLPKYSRFVTYLDGKVYNFTNLQDYTASKSAGVFTFNNVKIKEGEAVSYSYSVNLTTNPNLVFTIPEPKIDTSTLTVSVRDDSVSSNVTVFTLSTDVLTLTSSSEVYFLQEGQDGNYQIYFGDDIISKKLANGNIVEITYLKTNGEETNQANTFTLMSSLSGASAAVVTPVSAASAGHSRETIQEIKFGAPLNLLSQNRAVTKNDYIKLIQQKYPSFESVNVWGGEENVPPVYGKIFISAKPKLGFEVTDTEKEYVKENILKPISMLTVTPEIVDVDYNYLIVTCEVYYDKAKTTLADSEFISGIKSVIESFCAVNLNEFNAYFNYSGLEQAVTNYSKAIVSNEIEFFVGKRFRPDLTKSNSYTLDYGFELTRGTTNDNFYSTPDFTMIDEGGVARQCFFEEIPSSYTGVQSITITNPGYNYTSTPTVTIVGDGEGATAEAVIVNGKLSAINVLTPGIGYTTAAVQITGGNGLLGAGTAIIEGRYGQLRISYYKTDEISSQSTKVIINKNKNNGVVGTIDYTLGKIYIQDFAPTAVNNDFGDIQINMIPKSNIIQSKLNKMLVLDTQDSTSIVVKPTQI
jgi:hypothetical protein